LGSPTMHDRGCRQKSENRAVRALGDAADSEWDWLAACLVSSHKWKSLVYLIDVVDLESRIFRGSGVVEQGVCRYCTLRLIDIVWIENLSREDCCHV